jgi:pSer/pThr/pTyr-binding forkhead associated (FHA) protein
VFAFLVELEGEHAGRIIAVDGEFTDIGRDRRNQVVVADLRVSNFHARLRRVTRRRFTLEDRGSTNGTLVNGRMLTRATAVRDNEEIAVGGTTLVLKVARRRRQTGTGTGGKSSAGR